MRFGPNLEQLQITEANHAAPWDITGEPKERRCLTGALWSSSLRLVVAGCAEDDALFFFSLSLHLLSLFIGFGYYWMSLIKECRDAKREGQLIVFSTSQGDP